MPDSNEWGASGPTGTDVRQRSLEALNDALPALIARIDPARRYTYVNARYAELTGLDPDQIVGRRVEEILGPENYRQVQAHLGRGLAGERVDYEMVLRDPRTGETRHKAVSYTPDLSPAGDVLGCFVLVVDIDQRRRIEDAVRQSEARAKAAAAEAEAERAKARESESFHRQILESIPGMVFTTRPDGSCEWVSKQWIDFTGVPFEQHLGAGWIELLHPDDREPAFAAWRVAVEDRGPYDLEYRVRRHDGVHEWFKVVGRPIRDEAGTIVRWFGTAINVHELKETEERLRLVSDNVPVLIGYVDRECRYRFNNLCYAQWFHLEPPQMYGRHMRDLLGQDVYEQRLPYIEQVLRGESVRFEGPKRHPTRGLRQLEIGYIPRVDDEQRVQGFYVMAFDITERRDLESELQRRLTELGEADRRKNEFLAMLAHELRNPLAPIKSGVAVLNLLGPRDPQLQRARDIIDRQVDHMARLIDDLLEVSRITRGKILLHREPADLRPLLQHAIDAVNPLASRHHHRLEVDLPDTPLRADVDTTRIEQVVVNLLTNAIKYTPPGGHIGLSARQEDGDAVVSVTDTGEGLSPEDLAHVFELFYQVDQGIAHTQGGLGIGLTLVQQLVQMHGGSITARSAGPGQGSEFVFRIPLLEAPDEHETPGNERHATPSARRILVVDDNEDAAAMLELMVQSRGYATATALDARSAIETAREFQPDVALLDIGLPDMDGCDLAARLRDVLGPKLRLIAVSGYGQAEDLARSKQAGFDHHLVKPVDIEALIRLLGET